MMAPGSGVLEQRFCNKDRDSGGSDIRFFTFQVCCESLAWIC